MTVRNLKRRIARHAYMHLYRYSFANSPRHQMMYVAHTLFLTYDFPNLLFSLFRQTVL